VTRQRCWQKPFSAGVAAVSDLELNDEYWMRHALTLAKRAWEEGHNFRMGGRVVTAYRPVPALANDLIVMHQHRAHRLLEWPLCLTSNSMMNTGCVMP
jgi:hypothetical protein